MPSQTVKYPSGFLYAAIFLLTCGTLIYELSLIRLFSVAHHYHFAFLVVSIAMLGLGAAGVYVTIFTKPQTTNWRRRLANFALLFALAVVGCYLLVNLIPFDQQKIAFEQKQFLYLLLYYLILSAPPFFSGLALATLYAWQSQKIHRLYFFDIAGAAIGSVLVLWVSSRANGLGGIWSAAFAGLVSSLLFSPKRSRALFTLILMSLVAVFWRSNFETVSLKLSEYKALPQLLRPQNSKILHTEWTPVARYDFVASSLVHFAPGLSLKNRATLPEQLGVVIDGGILNAVTKFNGEPTSLEFIEMLPSALPYKLSDISSVFVCEPLGGLEFLTALYFGTRGIAGAGIHQQLTEVAAQKFPDFSGGVFSHFNIKQFKKAPRTQLRSTSQKYDLIVLPVSDSFGAASTGIYGPSEDYLLTVEAFAEYLQKLTASGWLAVTCYILPPLRQELRLISLAIHGLERVNKTPPENHLLAFRTLETFTVLVKSTAVTVQDCEIFKAFCEQRGFDTVFYAGISQSELNRFNRFSSPIFYETISRIISKNSRAAFYENYAFDVKPPGDDRPFFGHFFRLAKLSEAYNQLSRRWTAFFEGGYLVAALFVQAGFLSLFFLIAPLLLLRRQPNNQPPTKNVTAILLYFFCIGLGFMLTEMVLIQRIILFLDHPLYAVATVVASLLVSAAIGSYVSNRAERFSFWNLQRHITALCLLLVIYLFGLAQVVNAWLKYTTTVRFLLTGLLMALPGFLMGFAFPVGIRRLGAIEEKYIPWAYGANGAASVVGASLAVLTALEWGFTAVMALAAACYFMAVLAARDWLTNPRYVQSN
ncbi:MAG: hypothetical protein ACE5HS_20715 [bacterium]